MAAPAFQGLLLLWQCRGKECNGQPAAAEAQSKWVSLHGEASVLSKTNVCFLLHLKLQGRDVSVPSALTGTEYSGDVCKEPGGCWGSARGPCRFCALPLERDLVWMVSFAQAPFPAWFHRQVFQAVCVTLKLLSCFLVSFQEWFSEGSSLARTRRL